MKRKLQQEPKNYRLEELTVEMKELIDKLRIDFHEYISSKQYPVINPEYFGNAGVRLVGLGLALKMIEKGFSEGVLVNPRQVQNWFMQNTI